MIGEGALSISSAARVCRAFEQDGFENEANSTFASLAADGKFANNTERDMHTWLKGLFANGMELDHIHLAARGKPTF